MTDTVFYSWQSDLPNKTNRGLIERALEQTLSALERDATLDLALRTDQATAGVPGAPDIAATIFEKIDQALVFVADVSLISRGQESRSTPNPNVLIELGYAFKALGPDRVVMVFNTHYGKVEDLPFDLKLKRTLTYSLGEDGSAEVSRDILRPKLESALRLVVDNIYRSAENRRRYKYRSELASELIDFLLLAEQMAERSLNPWFDRAQRTFENHEERFRDLAVREQAEVLELTQPLRELARRIDAILEHSRALGPANWEEYLAKVDRAVESAREIKSQVVVPGVLDEASKREILDTMRHAVRKLKGLSKNAQEEINSEGLRRWKGLRKNAADEGRKILTFSYYNFLDQYGVDIDALREVGRELHQLELHRQVESGRETIDQCLHEIVRLAAELEDVVGEMETFPA